MEKYLVMINADNNNNKFYHMKEVSGGEFEVTYGRVGKSGTTRTYPMCQWDTKYNEKIRKGYEDVTDLHAEKTVETDFRDDNDKVVNELMKKLIGFSKKFISKHYSVSDNEVTPAMVEEAQYIIGELKNKVERDAISTGEFNYRLEKLFTTIPRSMGRVKDFMAENPKDFMDILEREQETLNVMKASVAQNGKVENKGNKTVLEALNLDIRECTDGEMKTIISHIEPANRGRVKRAFRVENKDTENRFNTFCKKNDYNDGDIEYYFHGSRNQNWYGILSEGLKLNPDAPITGKMWGYGLYSSPNAGKALNYASLRDCYWNSESANVGYMAVFKVALKNPKHFSKHTPEVGRATQKTMDKWGTDGVYAHAGASLKRDEVIVYREEQMTIRYLLEIA